MCFRRGKKKRSPFHNADLTDKNKLLLTNYYNIISYKPIDVTFSGCKGTNFLYTNLSYLYQLYLYMFQRADFNNIFHKITILSQ